MMNATTFPQEKSIALFMTEGSSDKEYRVQLVAKDDGWVVNFQNGRRGKALRHGTKTETPISYEAASKVYDKLVASKIKGGYTQNEDGRAFQEAINGQEHSGVRVQLLEDLDSKTQTPEAFQARVDSLLDDPDYVMQQKHDGERRVIIKVGDKVIGANREGWVVPLDMDVVQATQVLPADSLILDGEDMGDHIMVFDLLEVDGKDLRNLPFVDRYEALLNVLTYIDPEGSIRPSYAAFGHGEKRSLLERAKSAQQEGVVFKCASAPYDEPQYKLKFRKDATCQVIERNTTKRSASIGVLTEPVPMGAVPTLIPVGNVTLPPEVEAAPGDLIDVRYLYAYEGGSLFQPVYLRHRTDKTLPDLINTLKFKAKEQALMERPETSRFQNTQRAANRP